jgi:hypothetical protein
MNKKILAILFISITIVTLAFYSYVSVYRLPSETKETNNINIKADSYITIKDADGKVKYYFEHPAILTNAGKEMVEQCFGINATCGTTAYDWIAVGGNTSAMAVTDTTLANEMSGNGLTRSFGTYASTGTGAWRLEKDFAVTGTQNNINSTGLFNASSTGTLLAEDIFSNTNVVSGDTLNITWTVSVS